MWPGGENEATNRQKGPSPSVQLDAGCRLWSVNHVHHGLWSQVSLFTGTSTPPGINATALPSLAAPMGVNGFASLPPQTNGQPTNEPIYTNGIHPYPGETANGIHLYSAQSPTVTDPLQQAYAGVQHYAAAYPAAYAPISQAFPQQPTIIPQQQREGKS
ncbi:unnamed protein product [Oncorhynchus mykiss]|uniref:Uncharacterized protein n=1 Tax=Oncorhynchus mykiss TaxID=8022 RepID=A0A060Z2S9_ONCMY|nr:unnamed protein product [Oncorhynchus mykiss]